MNALRKSTNLRDSSDKLLCASRVVAMVVFFRLKFSAYFRKQYMNFHLFAASAVEFPRKRYAKVALKDRAAVTILLIP